MERYYTRKDFANLCGITPNDVAVYVRRGQIIERNKKIDTHAPATQEFLLKRKEKNGDLKIEVLEKEPITDPKEADKKEKEFDKKIKERHDLLVKEKSSKISKTELELELLKIKREKTQGKLLPTEIVKVVFAQYSKSIQVAFQQCGENWLVEISKKKS